MPDISQIKLPSGSVYDIKDQGARDLIEALESSTGFLGVTTTEISEGSTTNPITIRGESVTAKVGNIVSYGSKEFVFNYSNTWQEFGDLSALGGLAFKDSATGSYTPEGTVGTPTITVTPSTDKVKGMATAGSLPSFSATVSNEVLTLGWDAGSLPTQSAEKTFVTGIASATSTQPSFTGTSKNVTVS